MDPPFTACVANPASAIAQDYDDCQQPAANKAAWHAILCLEMNDMPHFTAFAGLSLAIKMHEGCWLSFSSSGIFHILSPIRFSITQSLWRRGAQQWQPCDSTDCCSNCEMTQVASVQWPEL